MLTMSSRHPDIEEFIDVKKDLNKVRAVLSNSPTQNAVYLFLTPGTRQVGALLYISYFHRRCKQLEPSVGIILWPIIRVQTIGLPRQI